MRFNQNNWKTLKVKDINKLFANNRNIHLKIFKNLNLPI